MDNYSTNHAVSNPLTIAFADVFSYIFEFERCCATKQPDINEVKNGLISMLEASADYILTESVDLRDYDDARFAVCAWIDEVILHMPWTYRDSWQRNLLQNKFYGTVNAGSEFYDRLNILGHENVIVREVYFICLALGFKGKYSLADDTVLLNKIQESIFATLVDETKIMPGDKKLLPEMARQLEDKEGIYTEQKTEQKFLDFNRNYSLRLLLIPPLFLVLVYFIYSYFLNGIAGNIISHVVAKQ